MVVLSSCPMRAKTKVCFLILSVFCSVSFDRMVLPVRWLLSELRVTHPHWCAVSLNRKGMFFFLLCCYLWPNVYINICFTIDKSLLNGQSLEDHAALDIYFLWADCRCVLKLKQIICISRLNLWPPGTVQGACASTWSKEWRHVSHLTLWTLLTVALWVQ